MAHFFKENNDNMVPRIVSKVLVSLSRSPLLVVLKLVSFKFQMHGRVVCLGVNIIW